MPRIVVELDQKRARFLYIAQNLVWVWLGLAGVLTAIIYIVDPTLLAQGAIAQAFGAGGFGIDELWNIVIGVGGLAISYGVIKINHRAELLGHFFFAAGLFINAMAIAIAVVIAFNFLISMGAVFASLTRAVWLTYSIKQSEREASEDNSNRDLVIHSGSFQDNTGIE